MKILVAGSKGMAGRALVNNLKALRDGKNLTRPNLKIEKIYEFDKDSSDEELRQYCADCDFVFNFAGVNRPKDNSEFHEGNCDFVSKLVGMLKESGNCAPVMFASSIQATLSGRFGDSEYGRSKLAGENVLFNYQQECNANVAVYRFPNLMGHSRPNYNSAVSTFCWAIANNQPYTVNDPNIELDLLYIDDLISGMFDLLEGKESRCEFEGTEVVPSSDGRFCYVSGSHKVTLGHIVETLQEFSKLPETLGMPAMTEGSFEKKLYSLYLTYLPKDKFKFQMKMNCDNRGSFTELIHTYGGGQVSVNVSKPGITKGEHWHNSKWELFIVVKGHALIRERNIDTGELVEFEVSGDKIEAVAMVPGWTHSIVNLSYSEDLVTVMTCNEVFNPSHPDTFGEPVGE